MGDLHAYPITGRYGGHANSRKQGPVLPHLDCKADEEGNRPAGSKNLGTTQEQAGINRYQCR